MASPFVAPPERRRSSQKRRTRTIYRPKMQPKQYLLNSGVESPPILEELIVEILSCLPVKSLLRFKSVCKSWNSLISEPYFENKHVSRRSALDANARVLFIFNTTTNSKKPRVPYHTENSNELGVSSLPIKSLLEVPSTITDKAQILLTLKNNFTLIGSCNGLVCFSDVIHYPKKPYWVSFWNPTTRLMSKKSPMVKIDHIWYVYYGFGYDHLSHIYKTVLVLDYRGRRNQVKVFNMNGTNWRDIESFPSLIRIPENKVGVHLKGTLNWLGFRNNDSMNGRRWHIDSLMILSFNLNKEEYVELSLPHMPATIPRPNLGVLGECLCVSHDDKQTHFIVWQMKDFGVDGSWNKLLNISYRDLQPCRYGLPITSWFPLCMSKSDILMFQEKYLYNQRDNKFLQIPSNIILNDAMIYFDSLISPCS